MNYGDYKILLVDDEKDIIEFLSYNLKRQGFQVNAAYNGRQAIEKGLPFLLPWKKGDLLAGYCYLSVA